MHIVHTRLEMIRREGVIDLSRTIIAATVSAAAISVVLLSGCGPSVDASTWLLIAGGDTAFVGTLGEAWGQLDSTQRTIFEEDDNTVGDYIVTYGRRLILEEELRSQGFLDDPQFLYTRNSWLMFKTAAAVRHMLTAREADMVSEDDISYYWEHLGKNVVYTVNPGSGQHEDIVYAHLPDLPRQLAMHLDTLEINQTAMDASGLEVRLDNVTITDSILINNALSDSSTVIGMAVKGISEDRYVRWAQNRLREIYQEYSVTIDSTAADTLSALLLGYTDIPDDRIIMRSDFRNWTVNDLRNDLNFLSGRINVRPDSPEWISDMIDILIMQCFYYEIMEQEAPETLDSIIGEADAFLLQITADRYYSETISTNISVTQADIVYEYENLQEPFMVEEKRVLRVARIPFERLDEFQSSVNEEELDEFLSELEGIHYLAADSIAPQITRPLTFGQVPGGHGEEIFRLAPADTARWLGPFDIFADNDKVLIKLIEVFPERPATIDEAREDLSFLAQRRLEEQATITLIQQLEEKYELTVNEEILGDLPDDPGLWSTL